MNHPPANTQHTRSGCAICTRAAGRVLPQTINPLPLLTRLIQAVQELTARVAALEAV